MSPEFQRNLWREFSPHRMLSMPLVLAAVLYFAYLVNGSRLNHDVADWAAWLIVILALVWGTRLASESVLEEVGARTWDSQRMSSIGPWAMTWGKLAGSTIYVWYGSLLCVPVFMAGHSELASTHALRLLGLLVGSALLAHAVGLMTSLQAIRKERVVRAPRGIGFFAAGVIAAAPFLVLGIAAWGRDGSLGTARWYGERYPGVDFALASLAVFTGWAVVGVYRLMRVELRARNAPWIWLAFLGWCMAYTAGLVDVTAFRFGDLSVRGGLLNESSVRLSVAFLTGMALVYFMLFIEAKNPVELRRMLEHVRTRAPLRALELVPRWGVSLPVLFGVSLAIAVQVPDGWASFPAPARVGSVAIAAFAFLVRDAGIVMFLNLSRSARRADLAAVLYLLILYLLIPMILSGLGMRSALALFVPEWRHGLVLAIAAPLIEAIVVWIFVRRRWRRNFVIADSPG